MKSIYLCKVIITIVLTALFLLPIGCSSYEQPGETAAEGRRRHLRNERIDQGGLMADIDKVFLTDKPSKLSDKRIP